MWLLTRAEWKQKRQQLRRVDFRYNVLEEVAAFQRFQAEHSVFLLLRSISEQEILQLIQEAHTIVNKNSGSSSEVSFGMYLPLSIGR
ncbi:hypothetical protein PINS_up022259 [Pythium insidiosum]|nr:hypothetical protein PINS_up022259 [Pythium insidiosum]